MYDDRGWQAFRVALSPLWPYQDFRIEPGLLLVLSVASALTNVLFVALAAVLVVAGRIGRPCSRGAAAATLLNLHWPISMGDESRRLESGYFVWVCSFALLAFASLPGSAGPSLSQIAPLARAAPHGRAGAALTRW